MITNDEHFFEEDHRMGGNLCVSDIVNRIPPLAFNHTPCSHRMLCVLVRSFSSKTPEFYAAAMQKHQLFATIDKEAIPAR